MRVFFTCKEALVQVLVCRSTTMRLFLFLSLVAVATKAVAPEDIGSFTDDEIGMVNRRADTFLERREERNLLRTLLRLTRKFNSTSPIIPPNPTPFPNSTAPTSPYVPTNTSNPTPFPPHPGNDSYPPPPYPPVPNKNCSNNTIPYPPVPPYPGDNHTTMQPPPPPMPDMRDYIMTHWMRSRCPVFDEILPMMFEGFPRDPIENLITIREDDFDDVIKTEFDIYHLSQNRKLFARELTTHIAGHVLHQKSLCPVMKMQQIFVFLIRKELDKSLNRSDGSLYSDLYRVLMSYMPHAEAVADGIVRATHKILFEEILQIIQEGEFKELSDVITKFQETIENFPAINGVDIGIIKHEVQQMLMVNPHLFQCKLPAEFFAMHSQIARNFQQKLAGGIIESSFMGTVERILWDLHMRMGVTIVDQMAIDSLVNSLRNYVRGAVWVFNKYEEIINAGDIYRFKDLLHDSLNKKGVIRLSFGLDIADVDDSEDSKAAGVLRSIVCIFPCNTASPSSVITGQTW